MAVRTLTFPADYFSGADVALYFGDSYIDDIAALAFTVTQQTQPVYGYGSFTFDAVLRGVRLVEGTLRVNFRQAGFLWQVAAQAALRGRRAAGSAVAQQSREMLPLRYDFEGYLTDTEIGTLVQRAANSNSVQQLRALAAELQKRAWGRTIHAFPEPSSPTTSVSLDLPTAYSPLFPPGFSITVIYGAPPPPEVRQRVQQAAGESPSPPPIPAIFPAGTALVLEGVHLVSATQQVDSSGNPVFEDYAFLAKDIVPLGWST